ncbi:MAG: DUF1343 domain-containing protein [Bryobacteraceae bacterium]|nr:DUF1343 domain-containing protein [Bryobacteraceae bacterium]
MRILLVLASALALYAQTFAGSADIDRAMEQAVSSGLIPGGVVIAGQDGRILHRKAYGSRSLIPAREPMTADTIFDAASLTKVVAATSAVLKLFEQGRIRLNDRVTDYLPGFQNGKSDITIRHLLTHFSGLRPDLDLRPAWSGYDLAVRKALVDKPVAAPGERFLYSDINFILLGEIVRQLTGRMLDEYVREILFEPAGMKETGFRPAASLRARIAPTEVENGEPLRGVVHDETTRFMGGVSGHAGMFTTADDLARFATLILSGGGRIFSPAAIQKFTTPQTPADQPILRGLGWDIDSPFSANRGELFPIGSFGHTGFTGTSLWMDPHSRSFVIVLTNYIHPKRGKNLSSLRGRIATIVAAHAGYASSPVRITGYNETMVNVRRPVNRNARTLLGLDVLAEQKFAPLQGKRVGLITNHTGLSRDGRRNIDLMREAGVRLAALFSPEHGFAGTEDHEKVGDAQDSATGLKVFSLYQGERRRPTPEMLREVDLLVFDIQDIGARFYTYSCTMINAMEEAAKAKLPFYVLDRPNPITGTRIEGPMLDKDMQSFIGCFDMPVRHGLTFGELAAMVNAERKLGLDLRVIAMKDWQRGDWLDATGLTWVDPSPNMRSLNAALLYPGVALLEASRNYSVGRGTDSPFEQIGAEFLRGAELAAYLNRRLIPGVRVYPTRFTPTAPPLQGKPVEGVRFVITDRENFSSIRLGAELGAAIEKLYPGKLPWDVNSKLIGNREFLDRLKSGSDPRAALEALEDGLHAFETRRRPHLLY